MQKNLECMLRSGISGNMATAKKKASKKSPAAPGSKKRVAPSRSVEPQVLSTTDDYTAIQPGDPANTNEPRAGLSIIVKGAVALAILAAVFFLYKAITSSHREPEGSPNQEITQAPDQTPVPQNREYVVKAGDKSIENIVKREFGNTARLDEIKKLNEKVLQPTRGVIRPGMKLTLPPK